MGNELQIGKAGEHLVCADLLLQGYNAFLSDQGLSYDVIVDCNNKLYKIQVKSTKTIIDYKKSRKVYRFGLKRGCGVKKKCSIKDGIDIVAFVILDTKSIAYLSTKELISENTENTVQCVEFRDRENISFIDERFITQDIKNKILERNNNGELAKNLAIEYKITPATISRWKNHNTGIRNSKMKIIEDYKIFERAINGKTL